jgi:hypothetical protein
MMRTRFRRFATPDELTERTADRSVGFALMGATGRR